jgi:hypothetical protein
MKQLKLMLVAALIVAPLAPHAQEAQKVTFDASGWIILNSFANRGDMDARDLPRWALPNGIADQRAFGMNARQSRLRAGVGIPSDGFLGGATLKGFVEADFAGGNVTTDTVVPRLRHYFASATFKNLSNLSVLVGQTWGVAGGAYFPEGLAHAVMPRFGGAGFAFRRAPQVRVSGDLPLPGPLGFNVAVAALQPGDTSLGGSSANSATQGNDSAFPNLEGRVSANYKMNGKPLAEVGLWTHYGREKYEWDVGAVTSVAQDDTVASQAYGVDMRISLPYVTLIGHAFMGENLDVLASIAGLKAAAPGASNFTTGTLTDASNPLSVQRKAMKTRGGWAQAVITPVKGFSLLAGMGMENPDDDTLWLASSTLASRDNIITKNTQYSAGTIVNLTSKWRVSFEATRYLTQISKASGENGRDVLPATQFEVGSLLAF